MKKKIVPDPPFPLPKTPYLFAPNNITPLAALAEVEVLTRGMVVSLNTYRDLHPHQEHLPLMVDLAQTARSAHLLAENALVLLREAGKGEAGYE